ncbi:MAG: hypothetical protein ABXS93_05340 [Sulfurimonas sp.]
MVKKLLFFLGFFMIFVLALIAFSPKESIYYFTEHQLQNYKLEIANERLADHFFSLQISDAKVYAEGIEAANVAKTRVTVLGLYNAVDVQNIELASIVESFLPKDIQQLHIEYSILNPLEVSIYAKGGFGEIGGGLDLLEQKIQLTLQPAKVMHSRYRSTLQEFKKESDGGYSYVQAL